MQPDWIDVHCSRQIGLRTTYRGVQPAPARSVQPFPKDGLAIAPARPVDRIEIVSPAGKEARELISVLQTAFNQAERRTEDQYGHPITRRAREGVAPTLEAIYAYGDAPRVFYVEATRPYRQLGQTLDDCTAIGVGTGWFVRDGGGLRALSMVVDVLNCRREAASYMLPLGVVRVNDRIFWLAQFSGFDHERYVVLEIKPKAIEVVINTWGGAC